ncbi:MAG: endonuclease/exonuclease/phosphatase family protein [Rhodobacteraceae bacterium]|nr:endonuclease/exonuclease/phosphatase family protein [Paracoccaceae bacterium]
MSELIVSSYNIHKGVGTDMRRDPARTVQVIAELGADIVALQEVDRRFGDRRGVLDPDILRETTGLEPVALTDRLGARAHGWHGNLLLLRGAEVEEARAVTLPGLEPRGAIVADIRVAGQPLRIIAAHLGLLHQSRLLQARFLSREIEGGDGRPTLVMGDFNEWRLGAGCSLMPLRRELRAVKRSAATIASFPAQMPVLPLDRIIGCRRAQIEGLRCHDSALARKASDHLPITAELRLGQSVQQAIRPA